MSKRHQSSRRRTYGRRQHDLHERSSRERDEIGWVDEASTEGSGRWSVTSDMRLGINSNYFRDLA
jgi:hypothetical protein